MAGLTVMPHAEAMITAPALSTDLLAIVVAVVAFSVSGIFLLTLVPERRGPKADEAADARSFAAAVPSRGARLQFDRRGAQPRAPIRLIRWRRLQSQGAAIASCAEPEAQHAAPARLLPVVREGATHFVAVRDIVAVHANAHYTYVFDGTSKHFCPLPIGEVESRLDHAHFVRVHRSHIVNLERVVGLKRSGDHGLIELSGHDPYTVPVSRSRFGGLKSQLGLAAARGNVASN